MGGTPWQSVHQCGNSPPGIGSPRLLLTELHVCRLQLSWRCDTACRQQLWVMRVRMGHWGREAVDMLMDSAYRSFFRVNLQQQILHTSCTNKYYYYYIWVLCEFNGYKYLKWDIKHLLRKLDSHEDRHSIRSGAALSEFKDVRRTDWSTSVTTETFSWDGSEHRMKR